MAEDMRIDDSQAESEGGKSGSGGGRRGVTWDEETIAEHDKLRGTRQKIDEPPTPYHVTLERADSDESDGPRRTSRSNSVTSAPGTPNSSNKKTAPGYLAEHWHVLTSALEEAARNRDALALRASSGSGSGSASSAGGGGGGGASGTSPRLPLSRSDSNSSAASHSGGGGRRRTTSFSSDSEQERQSEERRQHSKEHAQFTKKRLSHYDEYKKLQEWRRRHAEEGDDDDEDEDDNDEGAGGNGNGEDEGEGMDGGEESGAGTGAGAGAAKKKRSWLPAFSAGGR